MNISSTARTVVALIALLLTGANAVPAYAATNYYSYYSYNRTGSTTPSYLGSGRRGSSYYTNTNEGTGSSTPDWTHGTHGLPSASQNAINALGSQPVMNLPIPVLLGVSLSDITPNFGDPRDGGARTHEGEDIMAPKDDYIVSPTDAVVISMGTGSSAGNYVYTANPGGETFAYMHLDKFANGLAQGSILKTGDLIGYVGNTGDAAGGPTHLHFEIRKDRTATDPFPRLTRVFSAAERVADVSTALGKASNSNADATQLVADYRSTFISAQVQGIALPKAITTALGTLPQVSSSIGTAYTRDLTVGSRGDDVTALQSFLIAQNAGINAQTLAATGATGYFGVLTKAALAEYQATSGISPAAGYFGPITRAYIDAH